MISAKFKISVIIVFALLIVIFTLQNTEVVTIKLWFWQVNASRALIVVVSIVFGIVIGMLLPSFKKNKKNKKNADSEPDKPDQVTL